MTSPPRRAVGSNTDEAEVRILQASSAEHIVIARTLIEEYAAWLAIDLSFQNFAEELANLPGQYAPPDGRLLLALRGPAGAGCVALRRFDQQTCEMKRMWVRPELRGLGLGRLLAEELIQDARAVGYSAMVLDSLATLTSALALYRSLGFREISPYRYNPAPDAVFMSLQLR